MAIMRRGGRQQFSATIWPGFVDAMTALLMILMFVLTIFMIVQFVLQKKITTQDTQLNYLSQQVSSLAKALGLEQQKSDGLETRVEQLDSKLSEAKSADEVKSALIATLSQQTKSQQKKLQQYEAQVTSFEAQVASLLAEQKRLNVSNADLQSKLAKGQSDKAAWQARISDVEAEKLRVMTQKEALQLALAKARDEIDASAEAARLAAAKRAAMEALIAQTKATLAKRETTLQTALAALEETRGALGKSKGNVSDLEAQLTKLAAELDRQKTAQASAAAENAQTIAALQARINVLQKGLSDSEKQKLAVQAAAKALQDRLAKSQTSLSEAEKKRLAEAAAAQALRQKLADTSARLTEKEKARLAEAAAAQALREKLKNANDELTAMTLALEEQRKKAEDTLTLLAAARVARKKVDTLLAAALLAEDKAKAATKAAKDNAAAIEADAGKKIAALQGDKAALAARVATLEGDKSRMKDRLAALVAKLENKGKETATLQANAEKTRKDLEQRLAAALAAKLAAEKDASVMLSKAEQRRVLLAEANDLLRKEKALSAADQRKITLLNQQTASLHKQLNELQGLLDEAKAKDSAAQVQIKALGSNLNIALARVAAEEKRVAEEQRRVAEEQRRRAQLEEEKRIRLEKEAKNLKKFKSEFFGKMRDILANQKGVKIVGDRFVFSSEVLFAKGSADLSDAGRQEIAKIARLISAVKDKIPPDIDWILRVDGHTDDTPLKGNGEFKDNWQLSQARALSVVRYMVDQLGFPPNRLAAAGFGQYQPINPAHTEAARAQNRRIELKFTER